MTSLSAVTLKAFALTWEGPQIKADIVKQSNAMQLFIITQKTVITYTAVVLLVPLSRALERKQTFYRVVVWREQHLSLESKATRMHLVCPSHGAVTALTCHQWKAFLRVTWHKHSHRIVAKPKTPTGSYFIIRDLIKEQPGLFNLHLFGPIIIS